MTNVKLFDHANVGIFEENMKSTCGFGFIRTTVFEDSKYSNGNLIPKVHKIVEFIYANKTIFKFEYKSQFDQETDEAVQFWTNVVKTTETGAGKMIKYFMDEKEIPYEYHNSLRRAVHEYEELMNPNPDLDR